MSKDTKYMIEVMKAYEEGKKIEHKYHNDNDNWYRIREPQWNWMDYDYRVKEEPKYRPYNNIEELLEDWAEKTHSIPANMAKYVRPLIWTKDRRGTARLITGYDTSDNTVLITGWSSLKTLFENFTYLDGNPCGIKE